MKLTKNAGWLAKNWYYIFVLVCFLISVFPLFLFDYFITFDGPWHYYNAVIQSHLSEGDAFNQLFYVFNDQTVSNYVGHYLLYFYYELFGTAGALKAFHLTYAFLFMIGLLYWVNRSGFRSILIPVLFPLIISFVFISGFYNFALAITFSFFLLGYFERIEGKNFKNYLVLALLLGLIYFTHILVFIFVGLALICWELDNYHIRKKEFLDLMKRLSFLLIMALPFIVLSLFFLEARENEMTFQSQDSLMEQLVSGRSIYARGETTSYILQFFMGIMVLVSFARLFQKNTSHNYLFATAFITLALYFFLPDQIGHVSVLSIRYVFFFWVFILIWLAKNPFQKQAFNWSVVTISLVLAANKVGGIYTMQKQLNSDTKLVIQAAETFPEESIVYPVFTSNFWEHYYLGCYAGITRNNLVLKNNAAHNDYFPIKYREDYEAQIQETKELIIETPVLKQLVDVDYLLIIGKESIENDLDRKFYEEAQTIGQKISENELVTVWKLK